jgi:uncharacterized protein (TIGR00255 family)
MSEMIYSMTGFGKGQVRSGNKTIIAEVRSLNSQRGTDISLKFTTQFREQEQLLRTMVAEQLRRGKIDIHLTIEQDKQTVDTLLNRPLVEAYYAELKSIATTLGAPTDNLLPAILTMEGVVATSSQSDEDEWQAIQQAIMMSIESLKKFRADEGRTTADDMLMRLTLIEQHSLEVKALDQDRIADIRTRLRSNVENAIGKEKLDPNRFEQEMIYYIEKLDITEELTRLKSHCNYFREEIASQDEEKGRKLNFITQEIGREINTMGSKAQHAAIQKWVVRMKDELEKVKEQVNNIM